MIGIIGTKLGMTQIFNEHRTTDSVHGDRGRAESGGSGHGHEQGRASPRCSSDTGTQRLRRESKGKERTPRGRRASKAEIGHAKKAGLDAPPAVLRSFRLDDTQATERRDPDVAVGRPITVDIFTVGRAREGHGHHEGSRLPGRGEALGLRRRTEHARQHEAPPARLDRTRHRSVARHQGQEDARSLRRRAAHTDESPGREDRRRAQPDLSSAARSPARRTGFSSYASRVRAMAETTNSYDAAAYTGNGTARERVPLPRSMFDGTVNMPVMHQAVKAFLANQRQGNAATKTRGVRDRRQPEAVEAEGHGSRASGLDARAALGWRRHGVRPDPAQLRRSTCRSRCARSRARARSTRAHARAR